MEVIHYSIKGCTYLCEIKMNLCKRQFCFRLFEFRLSQSELTWCYYIAFCQFLRVLIFNFSIMSFCLRFFQFSVVQVRHNLKHQLSFSDKLPFIYIDFFYEASFLCSEFNMLNGVNLANVLSRYGSIRF